MTNTNTKIFVTESLDFSSTAAAVLRTLGEVVFADVDRTGLMLSVRDADVLWVRLRHQIDAEVIAAAQHLKVIATPTTGLNHIDLKAAAGRHIQILSLKEEKQFLQDVRATAEHTVGLMLALMRHLPASLSHVRDGGWNRDLFKGHELCGKTIGIIGYGRLGRIVARYLSAFDARVLVADPHLGTGSTEPNVPVLSLHELLRQSDIITLHVDLCEETHGFFGRQEFALMKPASWFINTARGELVDENALLDALKSGLIAGAALDVLSQERFVGMREHPLVAYAGEHENVIITPHIGGCTVESMEKTELFLANRLADFLGYHAAT